ncbi:hypothetical protein [Atlantibacter hermannii]|uniref:hypothetical protein n=1 Tax=Atlantibacter hermannii TaxID=565 RepID=UPI002FD8C6A6
MNHEQFIKKHVCDELIKQGFPVPVAQGGALQAVALYRRMSQASRKGKIFDDVLRHAKLWAEKQTTSADRFEEKRVKRSEQRGLF